jgi:hypothetical protein
VMTTSEPAGPAARERHGGRMTSGIVRIGDRVRRPAGPWTPAVHEYLRHLAQAGFPGSPSVLAAGPAGSLVVITSVSGGCLRWAEVSPGELAGSGRGPRWAGVRTAGEGRPW